MDRNLQRPTFPPAPGQGGASAPSRPSRPTRPAVNTPAAPAGANDAAYQVPIDGMPSQNQRPAPAPEPAVIELTQEQKDAAFIRSVSQDMRDQMDMLLMEIVSPDSSEIIMNGPHDIIKKERGRRTHLSDLDFGSIEMYHKVLDHCVLAFTDTPDRLGDGEVLIEGQMSVDTGDGLPPLVARCHVIGPPVARAAKVTIAKKSRNRVSLRDMVQGRSLTPEMAELLVTLVKGKATIVLSGVSGSGKTTLLEAMSEHFDMDDRVILVEDTPELSIPVHDSVALQAYKRKPGQSTENEVSLDWLVAQANRMRPDRIIVGETRGAEMAEFLLAANSGADGSMTTIHANDPRRALDKMRSLAARSKESNQDELSINRDIASTVHIIVQAALVDGKHVITHIEEISPIIRQQNNMIATTTLWEYDRTNGRFLRKNPLSTEFQKYLASRGVTYTPSR